MDVFTLQNTIKRQPLANIKELLTIPIIPLNMTLSSKVIKREVENNIQGLLGYVVRWIEEGIGCSKVLDINHVGLMEDRATLRISSQHLANWLLHGICTAADIEEAMLRMAEIVDEQNRLVKNYQAISENTNSNPVFQAAHDLIFQGMDQPNGYTEPLLHTYRLLVKQA